MDGFSTTDNVVVIAASNLLEKLDPALLRPGRFDRQIFVAPPDLNGRVEILKVHSKDMPLQDVNLETVARQTSGLTGAELANICNEAAIFAGRSHREVVLMRDFEGALERVVAGMQSRKVINDHEKRVVAYHEAGHALCSELLPSVEQVHKISIVPRGGALGYTLNLPEEDRYLKSREELIDYMVVLLGGRVAEQIVFDSITTGASGDLKKVYEISRQMVTEYAMGTSVSSRRLPADDYSVSDNTRRIVDEEQQEITDLAFRRAHALIARQPRPARGARPGPARARDPRARGHQRDRRRALRRAGRRRGDRRRRRATQRLDCRPCSSGGSTTSESRSTTWTPPSQLYGGSFDMAEQHRETVEEQGVEAILLEVGEGHIELIRPLGARHRRRRSSSSATARGCTTSPTRWTTSTPRSSGARGRAAADRRGAAHRHPRLTRRVPAPEVDRRRADRDRRAGEH